MSTLSKIQLVIKNILYHDWLKIWLALNFTFQCIQRAFYNLLPQIQVSQENQEKFINIVFSTKFSKMVMKSLEILFVECLFFLNSNFFLDNVNNVFFMENLIFHVFIIYLLSLYLEITKCLTTFICCTKKKLTIF